MTAILGFVVLVVVVVLWCWSEWGDIYGKADTDDAGYRDPGSPMPCLPAPQADGPPPPYLSAIGCAADPVESAGHTVIASEHAGTTRLTLVKR